MPSFSRVILIGNLASAPRRQRLAGGEPGWVLSVCTEDPLPTGQGGRARTEWHRLVIPERQAGQCEVDLAAGATVYVEGRLRRWRWRGRDGIRRDQAEIVVAVLRLLDAAAAAHPAHAGARSGPLSPGHADWVRDYERAWERERAAQSARAVGFRTVKSI